MRGKRTDVTEEQRRLVRTMAGHGMSWEAIAEALALPLRTVKRHFADEYRGAAAKRNAAVAEALFARAVGWTERDANGAVVKRFPPDTVACIWWTKTRMGWREGRDGDGTTATDVGGTVLYLPDNGRA